MSSRNRIATSILVALLLLAVASPALAARSATAETAAPRISLALVWDWVAGFLVPHLDAARGQITPEGTSTDPNAPEEPDAPAPAATDGVETPAA
jgi:hypothetical protein